MAEGKYAELLIEVKSRVPAPILAGNTAIPFQFNKHVYPQSPLHIGTFFFYAPGGWLGAGDPMERILPSGEKKVEPQMAHKHTVDELFIFLGTDPHNPEDLGGEHEFWIGEGEEAEKFLITKTTCIFMPKGVAHNPNGCRKCYRPYYMIIVLNAPAISDEPVNVLPPDFSKD